MFVLCTHTYAYRYYICSITIIMYIYIHVIITTPTYSPGMPEMLSPGAALVGAGLGKTVALVTDGRFSGASHG